MPLLSKVPWSEQLSGGMCGLSGTFRAPAEDFLAADLVELSVFYLAGCRAGFKL